MRRLFIWIILLTYLSVSVKVHGYVRLVIRVTFAKEKQVLYKTDKGTRWIRKGDIIPPEGIIETKNGRCELTLPDGSKIKLFENSQLELVGVIWDEGKKSFTAGFTALMRRSLFNFVKALKIKKTYNIKLPTSIIGVRGTEIFSEVDKDKTSRVSAFRGEFLIQNSKGKVKCIEGFGVYIDKNGNMTKVKLPPSPVITSLQSIVRPEFKITWRQVKAIKKYELTIARDMNMNDVVFSGVVYGNSIEFLSFTKGTYFITIQSVDDLGFLSIPQPPVRFEVKE